MCMHLQIHRLSDDVLSVEIIQQLPWHDRWAAACTMSRLSLHTDVNPVMMLTLMMSVCVVLTYVGRARRLCAAGGGGSAREFPRL